MPISSVFAADILTTYSVGYLALWRHVQKLRPTTHDLRALPHPMAFWGPSILAYVFTRRHHGAHNAGLTFLVRLCRYSALLLPIGIVAFLRA